MLGKVAALTLAIIVVICSLTIIWSVGPAVDMLTKYEMEYERSKMYMVEKGLIVHNEMSEKLVLFGAE